MGETSPDKISTSTDPPYYSEELSPWIHSICVITFDLELGQVIESIHPSDTQLTKHEMSNICYLAFPDSNSGCMGDTQFTVRLRRSPGQPTSNPSGRSRLLPKQFLWGYVYFRQVKDLTLPRGYFQKSVVVLSTLSHAAILGEVCATVAEIYFNNGPVALDEAYRLAAQWPTQWPPPVFDSKPSELILPLPGTTVQATLSLETGVTNSWLLPIAAHAQLLWELVLTAEPIIVFAATPTLCSQTVLALVGMISPLVYSGDFRPYFTIHDSEFKEFTSGLRKAPAAILGVTNPFFTKTLQHWPHTVRLCETIGYKSKRQSSSDGNGGYIEVGDLRTSYKPFLRADKSLLRRLRLGRRQAEAHTALLRRHLVELTQSFMIPLERYMGSLMPLQKNISPFKVSVMPLPFNPENFFATLASSGPQLTSGVRGDWEGLYRGFLRSPNFNAWFNLRYTELCSKLHSLQLQALAHVDLKTWVRDKPEVEVVDMVLNIRMKISRSTNDVGTRERLTQCLQELIEALPEDLSNILRIER